MQTSCVCSRRERAKEENERERGEKRMNKDVDRRAFMLNVLLASLEYKFVLLSSLISTRKRATKRMFAITLMEGRHIHSAIH